MVGKISKRNKREGIDEYGRTEIHYASAPLEIKECLDKGHDINLQDGNGWCPLHFYAQENNVEVIRFSLEHGANPNLYDIHDNSPLWTAAMNARGEFDCVIALLTSGGRSREEKQTWKKPIGYGPNNKGGIGRNIYKVQ